MIEFYRSNNCLMAVTDSGGVQEELNMLRKPCATLRFNTDRPETVTDAKSNFIIAPISREFILKCVDYLTANIALYGRIRPLYGKNTGREFIKTLADLIKKKRKTFVWAQEKLGFWKENPNK